MFAMTGAGGRLGREVAKAMIERASPDQIRLGTREPARLDSLPTRGAAVVHADFDDHASLRGLFAGCSTALIISGDAPNEVRVTQHCNAFNAAIDAGVGRLVYTSFANATHDSRFTIAKSHADTEAILRSLGVPFTILRNNHYAENVMIDMARATGELAQPGVGGKVAYIAYADVAAAIAGAVVGKRHSNKIYEITGPEALDQRQIAQVLSEAWGRPIRAVEVEPVAYARALAERGLPPFIVELIVSLRQAVAAGEYEAVHGDAPALAGRNIEPISEFLRRA